MRLASKNMQFFLKLTTLLALMPMSACNQNPPGQEVDKSGESQMRDADDRSRPASDSDNKPAEAAAVQNPMDKVSMNTAPGKSMTLTLQTLPDSRDYLYCELVFNYGDDGNDIYSTSPLALAKLEWWNHLDLEELAKEYGAESVFKNGPQWWSMDEVGVMASEPVNIAGVNMVFGAHLPPGTMAIPKYTVFNPAKFQNLVWKAGKPVYQLVDADGHVYVLQGHKIPTDELATLGERFKQLPDGWTYRVIVLQEDLVMMLTPKEPIPSVQDEFDQIYIRIPKPE